jgi:hypothetical protein
VVTCVIFFKVVKAVHFIQVNVQRPEALGNYTGPGIQDAPKVRLGQLLPVVKGGRTLKKKRKRRRGHGIKDDGCLPP